MTQTERMRLAIEQKRAAATMAKAEAVAPPPAPAKKGKPQKKRKMCPNDTFFTNEHLPNDAGTKCLACGLPLERAKPAKTPPAEPRPCGSAKFDTALQLHDRGRLPDGAKFNMVWKGGEWTGVLMLADATIFTLKGRKLFRLLADIDALYREWKRANPGENQ